MAKQHKQTTCFKPFLILCQQKQCFRVLRMSCAILQLLHRKQKLHKVFQEADPPSFFSNSWGKKSRNKRQKQLCSRSSQYYLSNNYVLIYTCLMAAIDWDCLSFFSRWHSAHQFENSFWYFFSSLKIELEDWENQYERTQTASNK